MKPITMSKQDFEALATAIEALAANEVKTPDMPVSEFAQEGEDLATWAAHDKEVLQAAGLDVSLIDNLPIRAGALRYQQGEWQSDVESRKNALQEWKDESPKGYDLVSVLNHNFRFAFRNHPELLTRVDEIAQDSGHADMVQDLMSLSLLGSKNPELLQAVGFDMALIEQAANLSNTLGELLALNNDDQQQNSATKLLRDKAYTYLKQAVDEIRQYGKYVFWRNPDRLKGYSSNYNRD
jgi:hypothetical protein